MTTQAEVRQVPQDPRAEVAARYVQALLEGRRDEASRLIFQELEAGVSVPDIYLGVFQPAMYEIGCLWQANQIGIAREHYCTAATQLIMSQLYPKIFEAAPLTSESPVLVAASVSGDLHEIGVRMVADLLQLDGWDTHFLGANVPVAAISEHAIEAQAHVVALSVTLEAHLDDSTALIRALKDRAPGMRVMVGGHAFNRSSEVWRAVGADGYATDARQAVEVARSLIIAA